MSIHCEVWNGFELSEHSFRNNLYVDFILDVQRLPSENPQR